MRPICLTISAWGPYPGEEHIDFQAVSGNGLFLITGATGAGKTTIFDAVSYALYGDLSGDLRGKNSVRSDFAAPDAKTFVELTMEHAGKIYVIRRNPEYERPKKRQSGEGDAPVMTTEKENAVLKLDDGTVLQGSRDVDARMRGILQLDLSQFRQVSMIAQGKFTELITAKADSKMKIFREIFGTQYCDLFQKALKDRAAEAAASVNSLWERMEEDEKALGEEPPADPDAAFRAARADLQEKETAEAAVLKEKETAFLASNTAYEKAAAVQKLFRDAAAVREELRQLQDRDPAVKTVSGQIAAADRAAELQPVFLAWQNAVRTAGETGRKREEAAAAWKNSVAVLQAGKALYGKRKEIEDCFALLEEAAQKEAAFASAEQNRSRIRKKRENAQAGYLQAEQQYREKRARYEEADEKYRSAVVGIAAKLVREGEPCPVCGSLEHPKIAEISEDVPDEKKLARLKEESESARSAMDAAVSENSVLKGSAEQAEQAFKAAEEERRTVQEKLSLLQEEITVFCGSHTREAFRRTVSEYEQQQGRLASEEASLKALTEESAQKEKEAGEAERAFRRAMEEKGFADPESYRKAILTAEQRRKKEQEVRDHEAQKKAKQAVLEQLAAQTEGRTAPDMQVLTADRHTKETEKQSAQTAYTAVRVRKETIETAWRSWRTHHDSWVPQDEKRKRIQRLADLTSGKNAKYLPFEQYVLSGWFDAILCAANLRLIDMTGSRYSLYRKEEVSDARRRDNLEIEVLDAYTGRRRGVQTLSGGELFEVSLALALGMSDIVQSGKGGVRIDALFIDEGFGSLDEEALDEACRTLQNMARKDCMIGIISHVNELADRIPSQIVVTRTAQGSHIAVRT
jgi:exonuclease SbcC